MPTPAIFQTSRSSTAISFCLPEAVKMRRLLIIVSQRADFDQHLYPNLHKEAGLRQTPASFVALLTAAIEAFAGTDVSRRQFARHYAPKLIEVLVHDEVATQAVLQLWQDSLKR